MTTAQFETNLNRAKSSLFSYAIKMTKNRMDAEDLLQEASLKAYNHKERYNPEYDFKHWTMTILRNTFLTNCRKAANERKLLDKYALISDDFAENGFTEKKDSSQQIGLWNSINSLTEKCKEPFVMHVNGYQYQEIASALEIPLGTVKSRISYARKKLKENLSPLLRA